MITFGNHSVTYGAVYDQSNQYLYVPLGPSYPADHTTIINTNTNQVVENASGVFASGRFAALDPQNGYIYVSSPTENYVNGTVQVFDTATNRFVANVSVGINPQGILYDPDNGYIYVATSGYAGQLSPTNYQVDIISDTKVIGGVALATSYAAYATYLAYNPTQKYLYVAVEAGLRGISNITVVSTQKNQAVAQLPGVSGNLIFNPSNDELYVISGSVTIINGSSLQEVGTIQPPLGADLLSSIVAFDPVQGYIYVAALGSGSSAANSIVVISTHTNQVNNELSLSDDQVTGLAFGNGNLFATVSLPPQTSMGNGALLEVCAA